MCSDSFSAGTGTNFLRSWGGTRKTPNQPLTPTIPWYHHEFRQPAAGKVDLWKKPVEAETPAQCRGGAWAQARVRSLHRGRQEAWMAAYLLSCKKISSTLSHYFLVAAHLLSTSKPFSSQYSFLACVWYVIEFPVIMGGSRNQQDLQLRGSLLCFSG